MNLNGTLKVDSTLINYKSKYFKSNLKQKTNKNTHYLKQNGCLDKPKPIGQSKLSFNVQADTILHLNCV